MVVDKRFSIFTEAIVEVKRDVADIYDKQKYSREEILTRLHRSLLTSSDLKGIATSRMLKYGFRPISSTDATLVDRSVYENSVNVKTNYQLEQVDNTIEGSLETKAKALYDKQIAIFTIYWSPSGTVNPPTIDVSIDKDISDGERLRGTFLAADNRINTIENGKDIDISMMSASSFSIKWKFPANSDYVIKDTLVRVLLLDSSLFVQNQYHLAKIAARNILSSEATRATKNGESESYIDSLQNRIKELDMEIQGRFGNAPVPTSRVGAINHKYDRDVYADRAFGKHSDEGQWVEIVGNEIIGRTIRYTD